MRITRNVPLGPALRAAAAHDDVHDGVNEAFHDWFTDRPRTGRAVIDRADMSVDELRAVLPQVPLTPAGVAWKQSAEACLVLTLADVDRPYDQVAYETQEERAAEAAVWDFAQSLAEVSPLLQPVADVVERLTLDGPYDFDELAMRRARVTDEGIRVGGDGTCTKHDQACYNDDHTVVPWAHLNFIHPGFQTILLGLLADHDRHLPQTMGEDDRGQARGAGSAQVEARHPRSRAGH